MTEPAQRPSPAAALQARFAAIQQQHMRDMPMVNPALEVEALGFRHWRDHWLGILVTPWFMNLVLMPRLPAHWQPLPERESRHHVFPAGVFEFIGGRDPTLGDYQACSLFSPMFEFADQAGARATALAALDALFDAAHREPGEVPLAAAAVAPTATTEAPAAKAVSKRSFLFGSSTRADRGP
jgi:[NiFe] hydrogenase assembly HybE family chaperone